MHQSWQQTAVLQVVTAYCFWHHDGKAHHHGFGSSITSGHNEHMPSKKRSFSKHSTGVMARCAATPWQLKPKHRLRKTVVQARGCARTDGAAHCPTHRHALPATSRAPATDQGCQNHHHAVTLCVQVDAHMRRHAAAQGTHVCMLPTTTCAVVLPVWRHLQIRSHCPTKSQPLGCPCQVKQHAAHAKQSL